MVADAHMDGEGTKKDRITGLIVMGQAAALGSEVACYYLANAYHEGLHGLKEDSSRFQYWAAKMQRAAGNGNCDCNETNRALIAGYLAGLP